MAWRKGSAATREVAGESGVVPVSGDWVSEGADAATRALGGASAGNGMDDRRQREDLENALEALDRERTTAADLSAALNATEQHVVGLERSLREAVAGAAQVEEVRAQLARQTELAETYRIEAAEAQTMFDAMEHRIASLSAKVARLEEGAGVAAVAESPALGDSEDLRRQLDEERAALAGARGESALLLKQLSERESALVATRRARDQWLERLEHSGRERERLRDRLLESEKNLASVHAGAAATEQTQRRLEQLEAELAETRRRAQEGDVALERLAPELTELAALRAELKQTEEVWERTEAEKGSLAEELATTRRRIEELEGMHERASAELASAREEATSFATRRGEVQGEVEGLRAELARLVSERESHGAAAAEAQAQLERVEAALVEQGAAREELERELSAMRGQVEESGERAVEVEGLRAELARLVSERESLGAAAAEAQAQLERVEAALVEQGAAREELERELAREHAEAASLTELLKEGDGDTRALREQLEAVEAERQSLAADAVAREDALRGILAKLEGISGAEAPDEHQRLVDDASRLFEEIGALNGLLAEAQLLMEEEGRSVSALESSLGDVVALRGELEAERERRVALEGAQREIAVVGEDDRRRGALLEAEIEELRQVVAGLVAERDSLGETLAARLRDEGHLREEIERLQETVAARESAARAGDEVDGLRQQIERLEQENRELVARHSSSLREYREEITQQSGVIHGREVELERLVNECGTLQRSVDDAIGELEGIRAERTELETRLGEIDHSKRPGIAGLRDLEAMLSADSGAEVDGDADVEAGIEEVAKLAADIDVQGARIEVRSAVAETVPWVIHFDGAEESRSAVEAAVGKVRGARYESSAEAEVPQGVRPVLAMNFATDSVNPLQTLESAGRWGIDEPRVLAYCVKGDRGVFFGRVEVFPAPCEPRALAGRMLALGNGGLQRLLAVGEEVDLMSGLREELGRNRCSTAIAFDGRQAMDLIPMVKPQVVLVDLNLPRGDGLRVACQIRANPETSGLAVAMFWSKAIDPLVFRQQAIYAMRDFTLSRDELVRKFADALLRFDEPLAAQKNGPSRRMGGAPTSR